MDYKRPRNKGRDAKLRKNIKAQVDRQIRLSRITPHIPAMLWSPSKLARARQSAPSGFIVPCQPALSARAPRAPGWIHEIKHDGYRLLARKDGGRVRLWSRNMTDYTRHFRRVAEALSALPEDVLLDGEVVAFHPDGHSDFDGLRGRAAADAVLVAFDILEVEGCDLREESLERRRGVLDGLLSDAPDGIMLSQWVEGDGPTIYRLACEMGLEGIISKRLGTNYQSGRCSDWLKTKNPEFVRR